MDCCRTAFTPPSPRSTAIDQDERHTRTTGVTSPRHSAGTSNTRTATTKNTIKPPDTTANVGLVRAARNPLSATES